MFLRSLEEVIADLITGVGWVLPTHFMQEKISVVLRLSDMLDESYFEL